MTATGTGILKPGDLIDDTYRIVRRVGEGGMGEVYEATHARLAGRYAIKVLLREIAQDPSLLARFSREAQVTSSLRHPNIVNVLDFRQMPAGTHYIVMEYLEGRDLAAELQRTGALPLPRVADIVDQIASGLAAAHEQGIVHRDLKPPNLFLVVLPGTGRELVKIVDFGISKVRRATAQLTRTATVMGTPQYMSPEQALGQIDRIDARSDQFSLAAIVYEMISGSCAFVGDSLPTLMYQLVHVDPVPLTALDLKIPPALDAVVRRGLAKQSEARFASVLEFAQEFARAAAGKPAPAGAAAPAPAAPGAAGATTAKTATPPAAAGPRTDGGTRLLTPAPRSGARRPAPAADTTFGSTASESVVRPPAGGARPRSRVAAVGAGVVMAAALAAAGIWLGSRSSSEPEPDPEPAPALEASGAAERAPRSARPSPPAPPAPASPARAALPDEPAPPATADAEVTVEVQDPPAGLLVSVDGSEPAPVPVRLRKGSGQHLLVFQAPGHRSRAMKLDAARDLSLVLSLARLAGPPRAKDTKRSAAAGPAPAASPAPAPSPPPAARPRPRSSAFTDLRGPGPEPPRRAPDRRIRGRPSWSLRLLGRCRGRRRGRRGRRRRAGRRRCGGRGRRRDRGGHRSGQGQAARRGARARRRGPREGAGAVRGGVPAGPSPKIHFNMGLAHMGLARHAEAIEDFERFLAEARDAPAPNRVEAERHIAALRQRVGVVAIACDTDGADVQIDGRKLGSTPLGRKFYVAAGAHQLVVRQAGGGAPFIEDFTVAAGATVELFARLAGPGTEPPVVSSTGQAPAAVGLAARPADPAAPPTLQASTTAASLDAGSGGEPRRQRRWVPWAIGGAAVAVAAAVVLVIVFGGSTSYPDVDGTVPGD